MQTYSILGVEDALEDIVEFLILHGAVIQMNFQNVRVGFGVVFDEFSERHRVTSAQNFPLKFQRIVVDAFKQWLRQQSTRLAFQEELRFLVGLSVIPNNVRLRL